MRKNGGRMIKRNSLALALLAPAAVLLACAAPARADYLEDSRTARAVSLRAPRATVEDCLKALSDATGVTVAAAPGLAEEPLVGYVPKRPLRETMGALADLFDGAWTTVPGAAVAYRLEPDTTRGRSATASHAALLKSFRKALDDQATEGVRRVKTGTPPILGRDQQWRALAALLWSSLRPAERDRVLSGARVTIPVPDEAARPAYELMLAISDKQPAKLLGPILASFDLDAREDANGPVIRARATAMRENSCVGAIGILELPRPTLPAKMANAFADDPVLPSDVGDGGRFSGERDEVLIKLARACGLPILSRHRPQTDRGCTVSAGGRKLSEVMVDLAAACDASAHTGARGYELLRSNTEGFDRLSLPDAAVLRAYLKERPHSGVVPIATLADLAAMSPLQLAALRSGNTCSEDAKVAGEMFAVLRFYRSLTPDQRTSLFSQSGLDVATLTHAQIHELLDEKVKRSNFDIHDQLQMIRGLTLRFSEGLHDNEYSLNLNAIRDGMAKSTASQGLAKIEPEERPKAER